MDWVKPAFAARLRASLRANGMSVEEYARGIGARLRTAQRWVSGEHSPRLEEYWATHRFFGWTEPLEPLSPDSLGMEDRAGAGYFPSTSFDLLDLIVAEPVSRRNGGNRVISEAA